MAPKAKAAVPAGPAGKKSTKSVDAAEAIPVLRISKMVGKLKYIRDQSKKSTAEEKQDTAVDNWCGGAGHTQVSK